MNIAKILRGCLSGTRLYSPIYGELSLESVYTTNSNYPIYCSVLKSGNIVSFTKDGKSNTIDAEHTLYPSKTQRDWGKFGVSDQATDQKQETELKPFDKVLVRDEEDDEWVCDIFSHIDELHELYYCVGTIWKQCIAYEGNEHLLRTSKNKPD